MGGNGFRLETVAISGTVLVSSICDGSTPVSVALFSRVKRYQAHRAWSSNPNDCRQFDSIGLRNATRPVSIWRVTRRKNQRRNGFETKLSQTAAEMERDGRLTDTRGGEGQQTVDTQADQQGVGSGSSKESTRGHAACMAASSKCSMGPG